MEQFYHQTDFNETKPKNLKKKFLFLVGLILVVGYIFFNLARPSHLNGFLSSNIFADALDKDFPMPAKEPDRWNVLILGIRGNDDPDGGSLSDSIMLFSLDKKTGQSSLTSLPRDIYLDLPGITKGKINEIYEKGVARKKGIAFSEEAFSRLTGVYIENAIVFDFKAFQEIIDNLDGIDITLQKPFEEKNQWGYEFHLPAGLNHLNGQDALYYARSRYSTNDFDRSMRQQQIILAIKDKAFRKGMLTNPLKLASFLKVLNKNIVTDLNIFDTNLIIKLASSFNSSGNQVALKHISTENLLDQTYQDNIYILLPKNKDWNAFRNYFKTNP